MRKYLPLSFLLLCSVLSCTEELPELVPRAALFGNPERMSPQISPDGKLLAWIAPSTRRWVTVLQKNLNSKRSLQILRHSFVFPVSSSFSAQRERLQQGCWGSGLRSRPLPQTPNPG